MFFNETFIDKSWCIRYDVKTAFGISEKLMMSTGCFEGKQSVKP